jgi:hypothetical protein
MDKVSFKITSITFFFFGAALILCACMNPVDSMGFIESGGAKEIIDRYTQVDGDKIIVNNPDLWKREPILELDGGILQKGEKISRAGGFNLNQIMLINSGNYTSGSIFWYISGQTAALGGSSTNVTTYPLIAAIDYIFTVTAKYAVDNSDQSTYIIIEIRQ